MNPNHHLFVYVTNPIDFWHGWKSEAEYLTAARLEFESDVFSDDYATLKRRALVLAKEAGWEGDMREGPYVSALPSEDGGDSPIVLAWKQDNNGTTFVFSPLPLEWLSQYEVLCP